MRRRLGVFELATLLVVFGGVACTANTDQSQDIGKSSNQLTLLDCQIQAQQCVVAARSTDALIACRAPFEECIGSIDIPSPLDAVSCARDAAKCLADGGTIADCRTGFNGCIAELMPDIDLPQPPTLPDFPTPPDLPQLPGPAGAINCAQDAANCVLDGTSVPECRTAFDACIQELLPAGLPEVPTLPGAENLKAAADCAASAVDCLRGGGSVLDCRDTFNECVGELLPDLPVPEVPANVQAAVDCATTAADCIRQGDDISACRSAFQGCIGEIVPDLPIAIPMPPAGLPENVTSCLTAAQDCLLGRMDVEACRAVYDECAGALPAAPTMPELPRRR